ncbi:hypothetical protein FQN49_007233 [Arthroderma sp. PD_2]|nr:hypothetical protein FQN49_007233 [Arthroderma sp. PD_2]
MGGLGIENKEAEDEATREEMAGSSLSNGRKYVDQRRSGDIDDDDGEEASADVDQVLAVLVHGKDNGKMELVNNGVENGIVDKAVGRHQETVAGVETGQIESVLPDTSDLIPDSLRASPLENATGQGPMAKERTDGQIQGPTTAGTTLSNGNKDRLYTSPTLQNSKHTQKDENKDKIQKLSPAKLQELTSSPESACLHKAATEQLQPQSDSKPSDTSPVESEELTASLLSLKEDDDAYDADMAIGSNGTALRDLNRSRARSRRSSTSKKHVYLQDPLEFHGRRVNSDPTQPLPTSFRQRTKTSTSSQLPADGKTRQSNGSTTNRSRRLPSPLDLDTRRPGRSSGANRSVSPVPASIPIPPFSIPTYLQLELSSHRPSSLYIHRSGAHDFPYESSRVMLERLQNFFLLPPLLEQALCFGTLACLDSWLHTFTLLPLQFLKAVYILLQSWVVNLGLEIRFVASYIVNGLGRMWKRRRRRDSMRELTANGKPTNLKDVSPNLVPLNPSPNDTSPVLDPASGSDAHRRRRGSTTRHHRRTKSIPSTLLANDKADILKGLLMIFTCTVLMYFDASRMYHWIRGQAAIKLYVIYNVLEVGDRLLSAIGQDVLECLFSQEALERRPDGRSKVVRPFWMFIFALIYTVIHATALFYQVMTLNVAVNSYSNALITLLLSNQFVEIKSTVFKKFEKENLFQLTCADVVERFQLWLMLIIIASRNFVETGGFKLGNVLTPQSTAATSTNSTTAFRPSTSILPQSFTLLIPSSVFSSLSSVNSILPAIGHLLAPFLVVLGSEMVVDWLKHSYISKFNNLKPAMYGRFLDILAKDYYSSAFSDQNLNRRLGLPVIPLACLFFRVSVQTYQMFLTAWLPQLSSSPFYPSPSNATSLSEIRSHYAPIAGSTPVVSTLSSSSTSALLSDVSLASIAQTASSLFQTFVSYATPSPASFVPIFTVILVLLLYITLLLAKLVLGMILLGYSRTRYKNMKYREREYAAHQKREQRRQQQQQFPSSISPIPQGSALAVPSATSTDMPLPNSSSNSDVIEGGRRVGGWGAIELGDDRRRWIYADDPEGLRKVRDREERGRNEKASGPGSGAHGLENVKRYEMAAKRIW